MEKRILTIASQKSLSEAVGVSSIYLCGKRMFDIVCGMVGLFFVVAASLCLLPFFIYGKNKGPLFFKQIRVGQNGKKFKIYKFRSMVVNAESVLRSNSDLYQKYVENSYKLPSGEDPRITKLGMFIRKTSLDELPQFINILKGEMSMIGPRPVVESELIEYGDRVKQLLAAKPGAMGLWQASGRSNIHYPERADLEIYYVNHRSFHYDLAILLKNITSIFKADGAF
ncbi:sugar transferase [Lacticaseibacillus paracasei]|uniref:Sugar transferase n=1 Tax=Lacticaseibacillus paracasei TaxID=1597 RepID=A0AAP4N4L4_LACPA|nr:sugar transferase [Lacticaseibacillus paracasei]WQG47386.1 sugar transferase [Lacticaseibacillus casei]AGP68903.1 Undecaprenyl-phosphate galactosephosphotransferase [Lacticaseibacillus paracasei]MDM7454736.1 sugar transferase [Lacticaseibacillus paracasei]MDM7471812.1 sugar transferase [Lacticaseibacillus paracasei]MDM7533316.1 sugar transferase [Lacticaseibacillus paracasei]